MVELLTKLVAFPIFIPFPIKCKQIGKSFLIGQGYSIWRCNLNNVIIGNNVQIGSRAWIQTVPLVGQKKPTIEIRDNCSISRNVTISAAKKIRSLKD